MESSNTNLNRLRELLIGKEVKGFFFSATDYNGFYYHTDMNKYVGKKAVVEAITNSSTAGTVVRLVFKNNLSWEYPIAPILAQLNIDQGSSNYEIY